MNALARPGLALKLLPLLSLRWQLFVIDAPLSVVDMLPANAMDGRRAVPIWLSGAQPPTTQCCAMQRPSIALAGSISTTLSGASITKSCHRNDKTGNNLRARPGNAKATPYAPPRATCSCGSVQQGLSAAGGALGFYPLDLAAGKRYSLAISHSL